MRKLVGRIGLMAAMLVLMSFQVVFASQERETEARATFLKEIGMFQGTENGYELNQSSNRVQGAVMVVRLLGKEDEALANNYVHPFTDVPKWADPYVGYLFEKGITAGIKPDRYGSDNPLTTLQYTTFLLRVAGYDDSNGDFIWDKSMEKAYAVGAFSQYEKDRLLKRTQFTRAELVDITYNMLKCDVNENNIMLMKKLINEEIIPEDAMYDYQLVGVGAHRYDEIKDNKEFLMKAIVQAVYNFEDEIIINSIVKIDDLNIFIDEIIEEADKIPGLGSCVSNVSVQVTDGGVIVGFSYRISREEYIYALNEGRRIVGEIINEDMNDFEKELAIHNYIVNNTVYDPKIYLPDVTFTMYGVLGNKKAVCQGYADAFHYMLVLAGIESEVMVGEAGAVAHAWNKVELDGECYQIDATWNDPVMADGSNVLTYGYFNVTDEMMARTHEWEESDYESCTSTTYNYYVYTDKVAYSEEELKSRIQSAVKEKQKNQSFRIEGFEMTQEKLGKILNRISKYDEAYYWYDADTDVVQLEFEF